MIYVFEEYFSKILVLFFTKGYSILFILKSTIDFTDRDN